MRASLGLLAAAAIGLGVLAYRRRGRRRGHAASPGVVGLIGLGDQHSQREMAVEIALARRLLAHFHALTVFSPAQSAALEPHGALAAPSIGFVLHSCDTVLLFLSGDEAVRAVIGQITPRCKPLSILVLGMISPACSSELAAACAEHGVSFVACPVVGSPEDAERGTLAAWLSCADGDPAIDLAAERICPAFTSRVTLLSRHDVRQAPTMRLVSNFLVYGAVELIAEAAALAVRCGQGHDALPQLLDALAPGGVFGLDGHTVDLDGIATLRSLVRSAPPPGGAPGAASRRAPSLPLLDAASEHVSAAPAALPANGCPDAPALAQSLGVAYAALLDQGQGAMPPGQAVRATTGVK